MCGICGIFHYRDGRPVDERLLREMTAAIAHRGPDDDGFFIDDGIGLGMRRLSIIDLEGGAQPISNESDSVVTVFNGEIYNFRGLRRELESFGHVFRTHTDTETIVHGYEQWGFGGLAKLNGMFGLAVWDRRERCLVIARDPYGIKPLYYNDDGSSLRFGSEIKSILCDDAVPREVDRAALDAFLTLTYVPSPGTAFAGIGKVPPGFALVCDAGGCRLRRFHFAAPHLLAVEARDEPQLVRRLQDLIEAVLSVVVCHPGADSALDPTLGFEVLPDVAVGLTPQTSGHCLIHVALIHQGHCASHHLRDMVSGLFMIARTGRISNDQVLLVGLGRTETHGEGIDGHDRHTSRNRSLRVAGPPDLLDR